jgi:GNAT superfamily N-acetyltransferase
MNIRIAKLEEFEEIARIHASSWSHFYRNILSDNYLDNEVLPDRLSVWHKRSEIVDPKRHVIVAVDNEKIIGFSCTYIDHKSGYGALLDNLHVLSTHQGQGIGIALMQQSFDWVKSKRPDQPMFLTVLKENNKSKEFYYRFGGNFDEEFLEKTPYGTKLLVERVSWKERPILKQK